MMSEPESQIFKQLKDKISKVLELYDKEKNKNELLLKENQNLKERVKTAHQNLDDIQTKYDKLKIAKKIMASSTNLNDARLKVNRMVREIDRCIALLNR
jgi:DNA repair ATPase RecN